MNGRRSDAEEENDVETGAQEIECPVCGAVNEPGTEECRICGATLMIEDVAGDIDTAQPDSGSDESPVDEREAADTEVEEASDLNEDHVECPICGAENPAGSVECSVCGAELSPEVNMDESVSDDLEEAGGPIESEELQGEEVAEEEPSAPDSPSEEEALSEDVLDVTDESAEDVAEESPDLEGAESTPEDSDSETEGEAADEEIIDEDVVMEGEEEPPVPEEEEEEIILEEGEPASEEVSEDEAADTEDVTDADEPLKECEFCGAEVPVSAKVCPVCGEKFNGDEIECPVCGAHNPAGSEVCVVCGAELKGLPEKEEAAPDEEAEKPDLAEPEEDKEVTPEGEESGEVTASDLLCPVCGSPVKADDVMCKNCWTDLTIMVKCPSCGALNQPDSSTCRICFATLQPVELQVPEEPEEPEVEEEPEPVEEPEEKVAEEEVEKGVVSCPACSSTNYHMTDEGLAICDDCGNVFAVTEAEISCPVCGESDFDVSDSGLARCNACGNVFFVDIVKPEAEPEVEEEEPKEPKPLKVHYPPKKFDWSTYAVIGLVFVLLLSSAIPFLMPIPQAPREIISPDGQFGDWQNITSYADSLTDSPYNPNINIEETKVASDFRNIYFYLRVTGTQFGDQRGDVTRIFVDTDNDPTTGYAMMNFGAEYLIKITGHGGAVSATSVYSFNGGNRYDWAGFESARVVATPYSSGSEMEVRMSLESMQLNETPMVSVMFFTSDTNGNQDHSDYAVSNVGGSVYIESSVAHTTQVISGAENTILDLSVHSLSLPSSLLSLHFVTTGTADMTAFSLTVLMDGQSVGTGVIDGDGITVRIDPPIEMEADSVLHLSVAVNAPESQRGETIGVRLASAEASPGIAYAELSPVMNFYVLEAPAGIVVDGAFSDWALASFTSENAGDALNKDSTPATSSEALVLDITSYNAVSQGGSAFLYAGVTADIFSGDAVPEVDTPYVPPATRDMSKDITSPEPSDSGTQAAPVSNFDFKAPEDAALQRVPKESITGESSMMFFIDSDRNVSTGYMIGGIGADYMVKLSGIYGTLTSRALMRFTGSDGSLWSWATAGSVAAASNMNRTEVGLSLAELGMTSADVADVYVHYVNWNGMGDTSDSPIEMEGYTGATRADPPPDGLLRGYVLAADGITPVTGATVVARNLRTGDMMTNITWNNTLAGADSNYRIDLYGDTGDTIHIFATDGVNYGETTTTLSDFPKANITLNKTFAADYPTAPINLTVVNLGEGGNAVNLTWSNYASAYAYRVYRTSVFVRDGQQGNYQYSTYVTETSNTWFDDTTAADGTTYRYLVTPVTSPPSFVGVYSVEKQVTADYTPPTILHSNLTNESGTLLRVDAQVSDNVYVDSVTLHYRNWNETSYHNISMNLTSGDRANGSWRGYIKLNPAGGNYTISYYITAKDGTPYGLAGTNTGTYASDPNPVVLNATAVNDPYPVYGYIFRLDSTVVTGADVWVNYTAGGVDYSFYLTSDSLGRYQVDLTYYEGGETVLVEAASGSEHGANSTVIVPADGGSICNVTLEAPHITLDKTVDRLVANPMDVLTYTISYDNGGGTAGDVWINDTLPAGVEFMGSSVTPDSNTGLTYHWHFSNVQRGSYNFTVTVRVNDTTPDGTVLLNNVTCDYASVDGIMLPQEQANATTLVQRPIVSVEKTGPATAVVNDVYSYVIYFNNTGSTSASSVWIRDTIPDGLTFVTSSDEANRTGDYVWHYANLAPGSYQITVTVRVNDTVADGSILTNSVTLDYSVPNGYTWRVSDTAITLITSPALIVVKTVSASVAGHNDFLTYRIYFNNTGSTSATHVWINDTLPSNVSYINDNASVGHTNVGQTYTWHFVDVAPGVHWFVLTVQVMPSAADGEVLVNNVSLDYEVANGYSWHNNDSAVTVVSIPSVLISKIVDTDTALQGDVLTYTLYYNNTGSDSCAVNITDLLPVGVTYIDSSVSPSGVSGRTLYFNVTASGNSVNQITVRVSVDASVADGTWLNNTAFMNYTADLSGTPYPGGGDTASTLVLSPVIQVQKTVDHLTIGQGQYLNYTITYDNTGSANASTVWINDTLPDYVTYVSDTSGQTPAQSGSTYQYVFGDVAPGPHSFVITVRVNADAPDNYILVNNVTLDYCAENGHEYPGSWDTASTLVTIPDIVVEKVVDRSVALPGDNLVYTIYFNNTGSNTAQDVWINDTLPYGVSYQSDDSGIGHTVTGSTYSWHFTSVAPGDHSFNVTVSIALSVPDSALLRNSVTSDVVDQWGHSYPTTSDTADTIVVRPVISVSKDVSLTDAYPGDVLTYVISYDNTGHSSADVSITDLLPAGVTFLNSSVAPSGQSGAAYFWNITVTSQSVNTLFINCTVDVDVADGSDLTNTANLTYTSLNGVQWDGGSDTASTMIHRPVISLDKAVDKEVVSPGDLLVYTITFVNTGDTAADVMVIDTLPADVTYLSDDSGIGHDVSGSVFFWNFSSVPAGSHRFNITVQVNSGTPSGTLLNNTAVLNYTAGNGVQAGSESDYAVSIVSSIVVSKIADRTFVSAGEYLNYTVYFNNTADVVANHVWINDTLPDGVTFYSSSYNSTPVAPDSSVGQVYRWHFTGVSPNSLNMLVITVRVDADVLLGQELRNVVFLNYTDDADNLMQETSSEAVSWVRAPSVTVSKIVDRSSAEPGDLLTYTVYYNNTGSDPAADLWINDTLPAGTVFVNSTEEGVRTGLSWHFTDVSVGSHSFQITVRIDPNVADGSVLNNTVTCDYTSAGGVSMPSSSDYAVTTVGRALITVQKTVASAVAEPGDLLFYTITFDNTGTGVAGDVWINDTLPSEISYYMDNSGTSPSVVGSLYSWHFTDVAPGSHSFQIYFFVVSTADNVVVTNTAYCNYTGSAHQPLTDTESSDSASFTVMRPIITVEKVVNADTAYPGDVLTYTIYYNNSGSLSAADVWINDTLPDSTVVSWHFTDVAPGAHSITLNFTVPATATDGDTLVNDVTCDYSSYAGNPYGRTEARANTTVIAPIIWVVKQVDLSVATVGDLLNYTIYFNNTGSGTAASVWINDTLPSGLTPVSSNFTEAGGVMISDGHWLFTNVAPGLHSFYFTVLVNVSVADNTTLVNSVSLEYLVNTGLNGPRSTDSAATQVYRPMITVRKTVDMAAANPGDYLNYTIYYNNTGHANAGDVWINDTLPAGVTFVTSSDEPHRVADYVWHFTDVAPGVHALTVTVHVPTDTQSSALTNWAFLNYTTTAGTSLETSSDSATTLVNAPYILVSKTVNMETVYPGGTLVYTIYYNNTGNGAAGDVWINDTLPAGVTFVTSSEEGARTGMSWHFTAVSPGAHSFTVTVTVGDLSDGTILLNEVTCEYTAQNGLSMVSSSDSATTTVIRPIFSVQKTVDLATAYPGDTLVYTITFDNTGSGTADDVWINDTLPGYVAYISSSQPYESHTGNIYVWHFTSVAPGAHTLTITVQVLPTTPDDVYMTNTVDLNYTTPFSLYSGGNDTATTRIIRPVLSLVKTVDHSVASPGMFLNYTIYCNNTGHGLADIWLNDTLPSDVVFINSSMEANRTGNYTWHFTNVGPGNYVLVITVQVRTTASYGDITNYVYLDYGYESLSDSATTEITALATVKTVSLSHASPGDTLTYTIWYNNTASVNADAVWVNDTIPAGVTFVNATAGYVNSGLTYSWTFTNVPPGSHFLTINVTINATTLPGTILTNYVHLNYTMNGINMPGSSDTALTMVDRPIITVEKVVDISEATLGTVLTYTVYYNNTGTVRSGDVWINDTLPSGVTFGTSSAETNRTGMSWHFENVTVGDHSFTFTVTVDNAALIDDSYLVNRVFLNYTDQLGNMLEESNASATSHFTRPNITVSKVVDRATAAPGDTMVYTIYFNNTGAGIAGDVWINDTLPAGVTFVTSSEEGARTGFSWHFANVAPGTHSLTITVTVNAGLASGTVLTNTVDLEYETTEGFALSGSSDSASTTVLVTTITLDKVADRTTAYPREIITYTIFFNVTGAPAQDVWINDTLPAGVSYYSGPTGIEHTYSGQFHSWHLTNVGVGSHNITVRVMVSADAANGQVLTNSVNLNYTDWEGNGMPSPNPATVDVTVVRPIITISKTGPANAYPGDDITYTITVDNTGGAASDVWVNDTLPAGVTYSASSVAPVGGSGSTYFWHFSAVSGTLTFTVTVHVVSTSNGDILHNSVSCEYAAGGYSYADVPNATADTEVIRPIITVSKSVDASVASPGDTLIYTIIYNNLGSGVAARVWINDTLPAGTEWLSDTSGTGPTYSGNNYTWIFNDVSPGPHMFTVTVTINSSVSDRNLLNNTVTGDYRQANGVVYAMNSDYAVTTVRRASLTFNLTEMPSPLYPGDAGLYIVTFNSTASSYCDAAVTLVLPSGLTYLMDNSGRRPVRDGNNLTWTFYDVAPGSLTSFYVYFGVQSYVNDNTNLVARGYLDYTGTNGYHYPQLAESASVLVIRPVIETSITLDRSVAQPGDDITYTIYYNNTGHGTASTVDISLNLSGPFTYLSDTAAVSYTLIGGEYVYSISNVAPGDHSFAVTVHVRETAEDGDSIEALSVLNYEISNGLTFRPSSDSAMTDIVRPVMNLDKTADMSHTSPGGFVVFTITYSNTGSTNASDVWINDTLQSGMTFVTSSDEANRTDMSWHFTDVAPGVYTLTITVRIDADVANSAHLVNTVTLDYLSSNGLQYETLSSSATVVSERPQIQLAKIADLYNVTIGSFVNYTIYYNNTMSGTAGDVWINETIPDGFEFVTSTEEDARNGMSWHFTNVSFGSHSLNITLRVSESAVEGPADNGVLCDYTAVSGLWLGNSSAAVSVMVSIPVPSVDNGPVIYHTPVERQRALLDINITAVVTDDFGVAGVYLFYTTVDNSTFNRVAMSLLSGDALNGTYSATIPGQIWKGIVSYYIWADDTAGNVTVHGVHDIEIYLPSYTVWGHVYQANGEPIERGYVLVTNNATGDSLLYVVDATGYYSVDLADMSEGYVNGDDLSVYGTDGSYYNTVYGTVDVMTGNSLNLDLYLIYIPEFSSMLVLLGVFAVVAMIHRRRKLR